MITNTDKRSKLFAMAKAGALTMVLVTVMWTVTPALLCLLPGEQMTAAEHECCEKMAQQCGSALMPSSHTCCQHPDQSTTGVKAAASYSPTRYADLAIIPQIAEVVLPDSTAAGGEFSHIKAHFSETPPGCSSVLRI